MGDEADSPIIVPRPGQILRRAARTRKAGTVDGPHRFTSNRARRASTARSKTDHRVSSDRSSSDHGDQDAPGRRSGDSDVPEVPPLPRPDSYSEEASIYDAYASPDPDEAVSIAAIIHHEPESIADFLPPQIASHPDMLEEDYGAESPTPPVLHHPQPKRALSPPAPEMTPTHHRSPSPEASPASTPIPPVPPLPTQRPSLQESSVYQPPTSPSPSERQGRDKDKDKKGLFGKWGGDKGGKKGHKEKEKATEKEKEKDAGFFGSLFGTKKKQEETAVPSIVGGSGRETAAALLGASKSSKSRAPSPSPTPVNGYSRYPIHVERAIYRLSHIKLANPRRPLYEQVLISNLMFWYLGVINNKATSPASPTTAVPPVPTNPATTPNGTAAEKEQQEQAEQQRKEREEQEKAERERQEKERERQQAEQKKESRRGSLTKNGGQGGARRAEMPVRGPQYDLQHRAMEQEYGGFSQAAQPRSPSAPPTAGGYQGRSPSGQHATPPTNAYSSVQLVQPQPQQAHPYYNGAASPQPGQPYPMNYSAPSLPPGAMPPVNVEQGGWMTQSSVTQQQGMSRPQSSSPSPPPRTMSPPSGSPNSTNPRRARSPPAQPRYTPAQEKQPYSGGGRLPGRSLSATAAAPPVPPVPSVNGKVRKGQSAHAVTPPHQRKMSEEEDLPLAYYQQQRRK